MPAHLRQDANGLIRHPGVAVLGRRRQDWLSRRTYSGARRRQARVVREAAGAHRCGEVLKIVELKSHHGRRLVQVGLDAASIDPAHLRVKQLIGTAALSQALAFHGSHINGGTPPGARWRMWSLNSAVHDLQLGAG